MGAIRLILALSVVASHCGGLVGLDFVGGQVAVQAFFIISGFYMSLILNEKYVGANGSYQLFISNRLIRLFPIYWTVLILSVCFYALILFFTKQTSNTPFEGYFQTHPNIFSYGYLAVTNIIIFGQDVVMFLGVNSETGTLFFTSDFTTSSPQLHKFLFLPQAWTLSLELAFYLIAPFLLRRKLSVIISIILLSFLLRIVLYNYFDLKHDPWTYRFFPTELMFFLLGNLSYRIYLKFKGQEQSRFLRWGSLFAILAATCIYQYIPESQASGFPFQYKEAVYFGMIFTGIPLLFNWLKRNSFDAAIGELSYPVYISHILVIATCRFVAPRISALSFISQSWSLALLTIAVSYMLNKFVALPLEKFRQSRLAGRTAKIVTGIAHSE